MTQAIVIPTMLTMLLVEADKIHPTAKPPPLRFFRSIGASLPSSVKRKVQDTFGVQVFEVRCIPALLQDSFNAHRHHVRFCWKCRARHCCQS